MVGFGFGLLCFHSLLSILRWAQLLTPTRTERMPGPKPSEASGGDLAQVDEALDIHHGPHPVLMVKPEPPSPFERLAYNKAMFPNSLGDPNNAARRERDWYRW